MQQATEDQQRRWLARFIELLGGPAKAHLQMRREFSEMQGRWRKQDVELSGRILRAHLFVEHYMGEWLERANPRLGSIEDARLGFAQKASLLDDKAPHLAWMIPGIKRLNTIRNRLAHRLTAHVTPEDVAVFLQASLLKQMWEESAAGRGRANDEPVAILEEFARAAATVLAAEFSPTGVAMQKATKEIVEADGIALKGGGGIGLSGG